MKDSVNGKTKALGLIGNPVGHSFSPQLHNRLCELLGINMVYVPFRVEQSDLEAAVKGLKALNIFGFNVTVPHKQEVIKYIDELSKEAELMGAVNTVRNEDGKLYGYNTDSYGFVKSFQESFHEEFQGKNAVILGAGGAARAIAVKMAGLGVKSLYILNRTRSQAQKLAELLEDIQKTAVKVTSADTNAATEIQNLTNIHTNIFAGDLSERFLSQAAKNCDIIINTTSAGMYPDIESSPVPSDILFENKPIVCDIIANPSKTKFLGSAEINGCRIMNGVGMLYYQGIRAFEIWTGIQIPKDIVDKVGSEFYNKFK